MAMWLMMSFGLVTMAMVMSLAMSLAISFFFEPLWLGVDEFSAAAFILPAGWATTALHSPVNYATTVLL